MYCVYPVGAVSSEFPRCGINKVLSYLQRKPSFCCFYNAHDTPVTIGGDTWLFFFYCIKKPRLTLKIPGTAITCESQQILR